MTNYEVANQQAAYQQQQQQQQVLAWQQQQQQQVDTRDTGETLSVEKLDSVTKGPTAAAPPAQQATAQVMQPATKVSKSKNGTKEKDKTNLKLKI